MKKTTSRYRKKSIELAKKIVRTATGYCERCNKRDNLQGSHIIPVSGSQRLASELLNIKCLCYACHIHWWHKNPLQAHDRFIKKRPGRREKLKQMDKVQGSLGILFRQSRYEFLQNCAKKNVQQQPSII